MNTGFFYGCGGRTRYAFLPKAKIKVTTSVCTGCRNCPPDSSSAMGSSPAPNKREKKNTTQMGGVSFSGCGGRTRTYDFRVMSTRKGIRKAQESDQKAGVLPYSCRPDADRGSKTSLRKDGAAPLCWSFSFSYLVQFFKTTKNCSSKKNIETINHICYSLFRFKARR